MMFFLLWFSFSFFILRCVVVFNAAVKFYKKKKNVSCKCTSDIFMYRIRSCVEHTPVKAYSCQSILLASV